MGNNKYTPSNRVLLETAVKHLETLGRSLLEFRAEVTRDLIALDVGNAARISALHERFDALVPVVWAADRLVHEKETLTKQLATARRNLAEANAFINRPLREMRKT